MLMGRCPSVAGVGFRVVVVAMTAAAAAMSARARPVREHPQKGVADYHGDGDPKNGRPHDEPPVITHNR